MNQAGCLARKYLVLLVPLVLVKGKNQTNQENQAGCLARKYLVRLVLSFPKKAVLARERLMFTWFYWFLRFVKIPAGASTAAAGQSLSGLHPKMKIVTITVLLINLNL